MVEIGKNYYYVGVGHKGWMNKIVTVLEDTGEKFGANNQISIYICEDENLETKRVMDISLSKSPTIYRFVSSSEYDNIPASVKRFPTFKNNKYIGDF